MLHLIILNDTQTLSRIPLDKGSARRRDHYFTTLNNYDRQTAMTQEEFKPAIKTCERPQTHALSRAATGIGLSLVVYPSSPVLSHPIKALLYCIVVGSRRLVPPDALQPKAYCTNPGL